MKPVYWCKYLLPTEFKVRTVSCGPSFFPFDLWSAPSVLGPQIVGEKMRINNLQLTDREEVNNFHLSNF